MNRNYIASELVKAAKSLTSKEPSARELDAEVWKKMRLVKSGLRGTLRPLMDMIEAVETIEKKNWSDPDDIGFANHMAKVLTSSQLNEALKKVQGLDKFLM